MNTQDFKKGTKDDPELLISEAHQEHTLMNTRASFYLVSQSFLLIALGAASTSDNDAREAFTLVLPIVGIATSFLVSCSILAAIISQYRLKKRLYKLQRAECLYGPHHMWIHVFGVLPVVFIPPMLGIVWIYLMCVLSSTENLICNCLQ